MNHALGSSGGYWHYKCAVCNQVARRRVPDNFDPCPNCGGRVDPYIPTGRHAKRDLDDRTTIQIKVPADLHKRLKHLAFDRDTSVSKIMELGAAAYLDHLPPLEPVETGELR